MTSISLSPSAVGSLCLQEMAFKYVYRIRKPYTLERWIGTTAHKAFQRGLHAEASNAPYSEEAFDDLVADLFEYRWNRGELRLRPEERARAREDIRGATKDLTVQISRLIHRRLLPTLDVGSQADVERRLDLRVKGTPITLSARVDLDEKGPNRFRDLKTYKDKPKEDDWKAWLQGDFYSLVAEVSDGRKPDLVLDVVQKLKTGPKLWTITGPARTSHRPFLRRLAVLARAIETGSFVPIDPGSMVGKWKCTPKGCDYFEECPYGRARLRAIPAAPTLVKVGT